MSNWVIKLHDRRNNIAKYDCARFDGLSFKTDINRAFIYGTRAMARRYIIKDKARRPNAYRFWKENKVYVYPVKVQITEAS